MAHNTIGDLERNTTRKVFYRIIPYTFLLYVISYLDRVNLGYAALEMNADLALSAEAFGFAGGVFFIGYVLFQVPSNIALQRFGSRIWISCVLLAWGTIAVLTGFVQNAGQLYVLRFLLGVSEAGFFPGIIIYLTHWFRSKEQATAVAVFSAAIPASYVIGAPLSTWIMDNVSGYGLEGWRWMIILEGFPAVIAGVFNFFYMTDRPEKAGWLSADERNWLIGELAAQRKGKPDIQDAGVWKAIFHPGVLTLALIYFVYQAGNHAIGFWMPQIIQSLNRELSHFQIGVATMFPYMAATIAMILWSMNSDRTGERRKHTAIPLLVAGVALVAPGFISNPFVAIALISVALSGLYAFKSPFWSLPGMFLTPATAAVSVAAINAVGNMGGFVGPYVMGWAKATTGSAIGGLIILSGLLVIAFFGTLCIRFAGQDKPSP